MTSTPAVRVRSCWKTTPARWDEYRHRHAAELMERRQSLDALHDALCKGPVTRLTASRNPCCNHAVALLDIADLLA